MILTVITFVIMLCVLVVVHEYGHFLFARLCGIKIKEFAIGFGPKLFTWMKRKGTDFNVRLFPLGGFVSMHGESIEEMEEEGGFQAQPAWKRFLVVFAGPLFSFLFAVLIFISIGYFFGFPTGKLSNEIQMVMPQTKANELGLRAGDEIISIDGVKSVDGSYTDMIHNSAGKEITLLIKRGGKEITFTSAPDLLIRFMGVNCKESRNNTGVVFDSVSRESEIYKQGIVNNDILLSVNGITLNSTKELKNILDKSEPGEMALVIQQGSGLKTVVINYIPYYFECKENKEFKFYWPEKIFVADEKDTDCPIKTGDKLISSDGKEIKTIDDFNECINNTIGTVTVERNKETKEIKINRKLEFNPVYYTAVGAFGFVPSVELVKTNMAESVKMGCKYIGAMVYELFKVMTTREIKDNVGGPIAIASATNSAVNTGFFSIIILTAGLSLSLAIINLLPIPVLDGGHIFVMFIEFLRRKRFTKDQLAYIQMIGLLILIALFVAVMYSDISKLFTGGMPK